MKEIRVLSVCGMGFGSSLMMLMTAQDIGKKYGVKVVGEACDLGSWKGRTGHLDCIIASSEIAKQIDSEIDVVSINNIINKDEIEEKIKKYLLKGE
ncbi:MAG: PTS sugar transporter subunit IIB [Erysipelotrichaceae bacterium]|nr:PTS sugar transporter subunit IIB [Erysipelotrichaceae bacterium]